MKTLNDALISEPVINIESMVDTLIIVFPVLIAFVLIIFILIILHEVSKVMKGM